MNVPAHVGVFGGGRMGSGIAHAFLIAGAHVTVIEADAAAAVAAAERVGAGLAKAADRGLLDEDLAAIRGRLSSSSSVEDLAHCELVVEAVPESLELKQAVMSSIEQVCPDAKLATNTSSLSVDAIASSLNRPAQFVGLHFFNPVPASSLVEIVVGSKTDPVLARDAAGWVAALGKTAITVTDSPGFASSRLGVALALEAMRMLEEGVASADDIDTAMTLGYKHPTGPLRTTDIVGLDVRLSIAEHLARELGSRFDPPEILRNKVSAGELGRKAGQGFYAW